MPTADELVEAIAAVVSYNWQDELEDYRDNPSELHIFHRLVVLRNFLDGGTADADRMVEIEEARWPSGISSRRGQQCDSSSVSANH